MKRSLLVFIIFFYAMAPTATAQKASVCDPADLEFLTEDFLHHFHETENLETALFSPNGRLNLFLEYITFLVPCREAPSCDRLNETYAKAIASAETRDDLAVISANLMADVITCQQTNPLDAVLDGLGFACSVINADETSAEVRCEGENDRMAAQRIYETALGIQEQLKQISITLADNDSETRYIYTGKEWLVEEHYGP